MDFVTRLIVAGWVRVRSFRKILFNCSVTALAMSKNLDGKMKQVAKLSKLGEGEGDGEGEEEGGRRQIKS